MVEDRKFRQGLLVPPPFLKSHRCSQAFLSPGTHTLTPSPLKVVDSFLGTRVSLSTEQKGLGQGRGSV